MWPAHCTRWVQSLVSDSALIFYLLVWIYLEILWRLSSYSWTETLLLMVKCLPLNCCRRGMLPPKQTSKFTGLKTNGTHFKCTRKIPERNSYLTDIDLSMSWAVQDKGSLIFQELIDNLIMCIIWYEVSCICFTEDHAFAAWRLANRFLLTSATDMLYFYLIL